MKVVSNEMVQVNDTYEQGRYEKNWLKCLRVMSYVKGFVTQDGWTKTTHYTDP